MTQVRALLNLFLLITNICIMFQFSSISGKDVAALQRRYENLLIQLRPNAVGIVDGFDLRDEVRFISYKNS